MSNTINIAYLIGDLYLGGIPTFLLNLAQHLPKEFNLHFISTDNPNIHPRFHKLGQAHHFGADYAKISQYLKNNQIDIVQYGNKVEFKYAALKAGVPVVIERTAGPRSCGLNRDGVTHVVASNHGTVPLIKKNYDGPLSVIYNGININKINKTVPDRLHFHKNDFIICYCARMGGIGQGFEVLIKAVLKILPTRDVKLVLIGDKPKHSAEDIRPRLHKLARPMGSNCVFTGELTSPLPIMAGADMYVCPAFHHGISNSLIEAAALGKPIIATNVGQTNEIVHDKKNGWLVPPKNTDILAQKIIDLIGSAKRRRKMGTYSKKLVEEHFDSRVQAALYAELYKALMGEAK